MALVYDPSLVMSYFLHDWQRPKHIHMFSIIANITLREHVSNILNEGIMRFTRQMSTLQSEAKSVIRFHLINSFTPFRAGHQ